MVLQTFWEIIFFCISSHSLKHCKQGQLLRDFTYQQQELHLKYEMLSNFPGCQSILVFKMKCLYRQLFYMWSCCAFRSSSHLLIYFRRKKCFLHQKGHIFLPLLPCFFLRHQKMKSKKDITEFQGQTFYGVSNAFIHKCAKFILLKPIGSVLVCLVDLGIFFQLESI